MGGKTLTKEKLKKALSKLGKKITQSTINEYFENGNVLDFENFKEIILNE